MDQDGRQEMGSPRGDERLMPIGIFSRMTGLSHRALRLYADRGLLPPAHVDATTGYRYYDVHSIRAAEMIRLLRRLGVPLGEMGLYIDAAATDRLEETLTQQKQRLEQEQARLDAALRLLGRIDELDGMFRAAPAVELVDLPPERCLRWSGTMARSEFHESYIDLAAELADRAAESGLTPSGREYVVLLDPTDKGLAGGDETVLRYELCLPVTGEATGHPGRGPRRARGRPFRAQRLHRPLRGRLPLRLRPTARVARGQRPRTPGPAAHALRPRRAGHGRPRRLRHRAHLAGDGASA